MKIYKLAAIAIALIGASSLSVYAQEDLVQEALENKCLTIEINRISPAGAASIISTDRYKLSIKDGKVNARLPFFGRSYSAMIGGIDEAGIVFEDCEIDIKEDNRKAKKGKYSWSFSADSGSESVDVTITFWEGGSADISCICARRSPISYSGELIPCSSQDGQ